MRVKAIFAHAREGRSSPHKARAVAHARGMRTDKHALGRGRLGAPRARVVGIRKTKCGRRHVWTLSGEGRAGHGRVGAVRARARTQAWEVGHGRLGSRGRGRPGVRVHAISHARVTAWRPA